MSDRLVCQLELFLVTQKQTAAFIWGENGYRIYVDIVTGEKLFVHLVGGERIGWKKSLF